MKLINRHIILSFLKYNFLKVACFAALLCVASCKPAPNAETIDDVDEWVRLTKIECRNTDSLAVLAQQYLAQHREREAVMVFRKMGDVCRESDRFDEALNFHLQALKIAQRIDYQAEMILCLNALGTDYRRLGAYEDASDYHYKALRLSEQQADQNSCISLKNKVMSHSGIGNVLLRLGNFDEAEKSFRTGLAGETQLGSHLGMAMALANLGNIFEHRKQYDSAKAYYSRALYEDSLAGSVVGMSLCHDHLGRVAQLQGNLDEALREYRISYDMMEHRNIDRWHWMNACLSIIRVYMAKGDMAQAATYLERAERVANQLKFDNYLKMVYEMKYAFLEKKGDFRGALEAYELSRQYADKAMNINNINHVNNLRTHYETEKQQFAIDTLKREKKIVIWLCVAIGFALIISLLAIYFYRRSVKQRRVLTEQKLLHFEQEKRLIATQAALDGENAERSRLARDLHDGLGGLLSTAKLKLSALQLPDNQSVEHQNILDILNLCTEDMRRVAHHLMPSVLSKQGLKPALAGFCECVNTVEFHWFGENERLDQRLEIVIYRIAQELINNALKHADATKIQVQIVQDSDRITLSVHDNGKGFDVSRPPSGMGLSNVNTRIASFGGRFDLFSSPERGTEITVEFQLL